MLYSINNKKLLKKCGFLARERVVKDFEKNILTEELLKLINSYIIKNES